MRYVEKEMRFICAFKKESSAWAFSAWAFTTIALLPAIFERCL